MKKRIYEVSLIGLGVVAVATLAFGVAHRASKTRQEAPQARQPRDVAETGEITAGSAEGEALSSPINQLLAAPVRAEPLPRDEALADIWGGEVADPERAEVLQLTDEFASELDTRGDTYDGIEPEDLGAEWLARATEAPPTPPTGHHRASELVPDESFAAAAAEERDPDEIDDNDLDRA